MISKIGYKRGQNDRKMDKKAIKKWNKSDKKVTDMKFTKKLIIDPFLIPTSQKSIRK